jgi:hypothetical protein
MRKYFVIIVLSMLVFACGNRQNQTATTENAVVVLTVDDLMASAAEHVDQEVVISGLITHVCKHGGQRCFVMGSTDEFSIRVEAGDEIESFKQEHVGDVLQITGILRLVPVGGGDACEEDDAAAAGQETGVAVKAESAEVSDEEYVPVYYIDGMKFIVLTEGEETSEEGSGEV